MWLKRDGQWAKLLTLLLWAGRVDAEVCAQIRAEDPAIEMHRFVEMAAGLDAADEKRITTTVYGSTTNKYPKSYKEIKDKCKMCDALMEVTRHVSTKTVPGELSGARVNSHKEIRRVWSQMMREILEDATRLHSDPQGGVELEENVSVQQARASANKQRPYCKP